MNFSLNRDTSFLNADEASAVETALRTAVMSILKVFCEVNEKRSHCYEAKLAEAERENTALKIQLKAAEQELQTLRQISTNYKISAEVTLSHDLSSDVPDERREEPAGFQSDASLMIKEEPSFESTLFLKSEVADETFAPECDYPAMDNVQICQQTPRAETWSMQPLQTFSSARSSLNQTREKWIPGDVVKGKLKSRECVRRYRERIRADPEKYHAWKEKERLRSLRRRKRIQDLPEPMQKLQREAWREATRRHRARKMAQATVASTDITPTLDP
ncbi:hypothetical protein QTP70_018894 [Hemibagrus guttatus]|uniref:Uncharacterized protein n=1 Tax=Hemibagrus guttatus TaxID=175788 RepID=A0AAE0Q8Q5_9TELE|nr:hypothetical protein QTP70_018894 [Hemibagrus guttatus]KAK3541149.1 hypothetical protein QTP86_016258 [Hemibagrus guttatus]